MADERKRTSADRRHPSVLITNWREDLKDVFRKAERDHDRYLNRGRPREAAVRKILRDFLPQRYGVASGEIISSAGERSRHADIVVFDALNAPVLGRGPDEQGVTLAVESVFGIVEVKSTLAQKELADAMDHGRKFKALLPQVTEGALPFACAVFFRFPTPSGRDQIDRKEQQLDSFAETIRSCPQKERLDAILVLDAVAGEQGDWKEIGADGLYLDPSQSGHWFSSGPLAFSLFFDWLWDRLHSVKLTPPDLGSYLFEYGVETDDG